MRFKPKFSLITVIFLLYINNACAQQYQDSIYGLNPLLYNGQVYSYAVPNNVDGHQFLNSIEYVEGSIRINQKTYNNLQLNYDIYNQELTLKFDKEFETEIIKLIKEKIEEFTLGDKEFLIIQNKDSVDIVYQSFGKGEYQLLLYWKKYLHLSNVPGRPAYKYSSPIKKMYLKKSDQIYQFKNKRAFLSLFNKRNKNLIKGFLKDEKIKIRKINESELNKLNNFCNKYLP